MGRRKTAGALAVVLGIAGLSACSPQQTGTVGPPPVTSTTGTPDPGAVAAITALRTWLGKPGPANIRVSAFETGKSSSATTTFLELSGVTNVLTGALQMNGSQKTWTPASTTLNQAYAVESRGVLYTTPTAQVGTAGGANAGSADDGQSLWTSTAVSTVHPNESAHSAWWLALESLSSVYRDGESVVNTRSATEYTGSVDLTAVPGIPASFLKTPLFQKAGTDKVTVDVYTDLSTGVLVRVTYRFGLEASIDSTPVGQSTAGFQVDLWGFDSPVPVNTPVAVPAEKYIIPGGNDDLCRLLMF